MGHIITSEHNAPIPESSIKFGYPLGHVFTSGVSTFDYIINQVGYKIVYDAVNSVYEMYKRNYNHTIDYYRKTGYSKYLFEKDLKNIRYNIRHK